MKNNKKLIRKWFPFLNSWYLTDEPNLLKQIRQIKAEIKKAEFMAEGLPKLIIPKPEPYPFG